MKLFSAPLLFALTLPLGATQISTFVSTGIDVTGNVDNKYEVVQIPSGTTVYDLVPFSAYVTDPSHFPVGVPGGWFSDDSSSWWIGAKPDGASGGDNLGEFIYQTQVDLTGFDPISVALNFEIWADNTATVLLNGVSTGFSVTAPDNFVSPVGTLVTLNGGTSSFLPGVNTLTFQVINTSYVYPDNVSGFRLKVDSATGLSAIPEPATLALVGAGLVFAGLLRRRKSA